MRTYDRILESVMALKIIDSHEHLPGHEDERERNIDVLGEYLTHYFRSDLISAGLKPAEYQYVCDPTKPLTERWKTVEPYWMLARNTGYGRALDKTARALYGIDRISGSTIEALNDAFLKTLQPGQNQYRRVLKDLSNIEYSVLDSDLDCDRTFFRSVLNINGFIAPPSWDEIEETARDAGMSVSCFADWLDVCTALLEDALRRGAVAFKCSLAYERSLAFETYTWYDAEAAFNEMLPLKTRPTWKKGPTVFAKAFQDYMMHHILRFANKHGVTIQFHTGLQEGNGNLIANSDPALLSNLFVLYPNARFDLFHIGYPYQSTMSALGKMFPNVFVDMCWAHIISPAACIHALDDWLDAMPVNKIIAFGGDYCLVDAVYAHQLFARENVSRALAKKVDEGIFGLDEAVWMARRMFYDNPKSLYGE